MGGLSSRLTRQYYRYNAENRAHRVLSKSEPRPAPKHESTLKEMEKMKREMPTLQDDLSKFDEPLHDRLKKVYVTSSDVMPQEKISNKAPRLSHKVRRTDDFGFEENEDVEEGRIQLKSAIDMITKHNRNENATFESLSKEYKISETDTKNILRYFNCFALRVPRNIVDKDKYFNKLLFGREDGRILTPKMFIKEIESKQGQIGDITVPVLSATVANAEKTANDTDTSKTSANKEDTSETFGSGEDAVKMSANEQDKTVGSGEDTVKTSADEENTSRTTLSDDGTSKTSTNS